MSALTTDLYELTMAAGYFLAGKQDEIGTFELSIRRLPANRNFLVAAGLQQAVEYLLDFHFTEEEIAYLQTLEQLSNAPPEFFDYLRQLRFEGDIFAMPEGTPVFPGEPVVIVRAPLIQGQLVETYLLSTIAFQTTIASKAIRCVTAAEGRPIVEFGSRRAHTPEAGILAGRAAYIAGCAGTSNTRAGMRYGIPVFGTAAHSWTMAFPSEEESFRSLQRLLGDSTVYLVDTYDTLAGTRLAASLGHPIWGVRLDSGDLNALSHEVRQILDETGHPSANIMATNELNEDIIAKLVLAGAPIDAFGVGTALATSSDAPSISAVYKLVELQSANSHAYTAKYSAEKSTLPAAKQVYRSPKSDLITLYNECGPHLPGEPLLRPILTKGQLLEPLPSTRKIRNYAAHSIQKLPKELLSIDSSADYPVNISQALQKLIDNIKNTYQATQA